MNQKGLTYIIDDEVAEKPLVDEATEHDNLRLTYIDGSVTTDKPRVHPHHHKQKRKKKRNKSVNLENLPLISNGR